MRYRKETNKNSERGFTLAELVVSILILSLIAVLAYRSLTAIMRSKALLDQERDLTMIANSVLGRLTREFQLSTSSQLLPEGGNVQNSYPSNTAFIGEDVKMGAGRDGDSVTFMADEAGQYVPGQTHNGVVQIRYRVAKNPDQNKLTRDEQSFLLIRDEIPDIRPYDRAFKQIMTFPITDKLISFDVQYYDKEQERWENEWDKTKGRRPAVIRLQIELKGENEMSQGFSTILPVCRDDC